uniref:DUF2040 domain-containing protein n=1 Tax=Angiostrongylus cantonensis TaxID=6313 RepID=A0A0K0D7R2_ANGCA
GNGLPLLSGSKPVNGKSSYGADEVDVSNRIQSASTIRVQKHAERLQEMAIAEDPTVFDYDASYDQIQAARDEKVPERKKADKERKSKYALDIIKAHKRRELEQHSREERQQQKERSEEGDQFADKEVFVTNEYRRQMEEVQKFREEEAYEKRFNACKQKVRILWKMDARKQIECRKSWYPHSKREGSCKKMAYQLELLF